MKISNLLKIASIAISILILLSGLTLLTLLKDIERENEALRLDKELEVLTTQLQGASDYLTNEIRAYTQFGDQEHYDNYWEEVNETKTRDMVVERLKELNVPNELLDLVELAQTNSNNLIELEEKAMEAVANNDLALARELVYGDEYNKGKEIIAAPLNEFKTELHQWTNENISAAEDGVAAKTTLLFISMGLVVLGTLSLFVLLFIKINPLNKLTEMSQQLAEGNLNIETLPIRFKDEVGNLTASFNNMKNQQKSVLMTINQASEDLSASAEELLASTEQITSTTQQVNNSIEEVADGTSKQSQHIAESTLSIEEVLQGIKIIANSSTSVTALSEDTTNKSQLGEEHINKAIHQMKTIENTVKDTSESLQLLTTRSKEIEAIITTISNISGQTNLLALNASIEAARAGEHGKGFAVVADEVKKLAEDSNNSAQQITEIIKSIQQDTAAAVNQMHSVTENVLNGVTIIENTGSSFGEISKSANDVLKQIQEMSSISVQIVANTEQVSNAFNSVNSIAQHTTNQTNNVSALAEEQFATMEEVAASTEALTKLALELNNQLTKFRL